MVWRATAVHRVAPHLSLSMLRDDVMWVELMLWRGGSSNNMAGAESTVLAISMISMTLIIDILNVVN